MKKILVVFLIMFLTFVIYKVNDSNLVDYMSLGDSINQGINAYGNKSFGYNDYIKSYLEKIIHVKLHQNQKNLNFFLNILYFENH